MGVLIMSEQNEGQQEKVRLVLLIIAPVASILFALAAIPGDSSSAWTWLTLGFSALTGTLALVVGMVTLIVQIARKDLSLRNTTIFAIAYVLSIFVFLGSCTAAITEVE